MNRPLKFDRHFRLATQRFIRRFDVMILPDDTDSPQLSDAPAENAAKVPGQTKPMQRPGMALVAVALGAATTAQVRRALVSRKRLAAVIKVPTTAWVKQVEKYLKENVAEHQSFARDGSTKSRDKPSIGNDEVALALSQGYRVIGIAANPAAMLPAALLAAADITVTIPNPGGDVIVRTMRRCLRGKIPDGIEDGLVAGLDFDDIVADLRSGSLAIAAVRRLKSASARRRGPSSAGDVPNLETAVEYGAAREWGLSLARDIADFRAGKIKWDSLDRGAILFSAPGLGKSLFASVLARFCLRIMCHRAC